MSAATVAAGARPERIRALCPRGIADRARDRDTARNFPYIACGICRDPDGVLRRNVDGRLAGSCRLSECYRLR